MHTGNHPPDTIYTMRQGDNTILDIIDEITQRDLGVAIENHLNFKLHISKRVTQSNRLLRIIGRSFEYLDQETLLYLYKGLIRPKLENARAVWNRIKSFFTQRVVNLWNSLPENLGSASTVNEFKNRNEKLWKDAQFTTNPIAPNIYYTLY